MLRLPLPLRLASETMVVPGAVRSGLSAEVAKAGPRELEVLRVSTIGGSTARTTPRFAAVRVTFTVPVASALLRAVPVARSVSMEGMVMVASVPVIVDRPPLRVRWPPARRSPRRSGSSSP